MINDKEFRQKCREFSYQQMEDYFKDYQERDAFKSKEVIKKLFGNYANDAAMILFDNIDEWTE